MRIVTIEGWESFKYVEVFQILQMKDGCVFKTKTTGKYILTEQTVLLDPTKFITTSMSTTKSSRPTIELEVVEPSEL